MDVPLWALLASSIAGPLLGAGLTVLGTMLNNSHQAREAARGRSFQLRANVAKWRIEQRNNAYVDTLNFVDTLAGAVWGYLPFDPADFALERYEELESQYRLLSARLVLHATQEVVDAYHAVNLCWAKVAREIRNKGLTRSDLSAELVEFDDLLDALHLEIKQHLDHLESV